MKRLPLPIQEQVPMTGSTHLDVNYRIEVAPTPTPLFSCSFKLLTTVYRGTSSKSAYRLTQLSIPQPMHLGLTLHTESQKTTNPWKCRNHARCVVHDLEPLRCELTKLMMPHPAPEPLRTRSVYQDKWACRALGICHFRHAI
ncbi:hypothetical protein CH063_06997, partial [Colletotrichum higginsianum]